MTCRCLLANKQRVGLPRDNGCLIECTWQLNLKSSVKVSSPRLPKGRPLQNKFQARRLPDLQPTFSFDNNCTRARHKLPCCDVVSTRPPARWRKLLSPPLNFTESCSYPRFRLILYSEAVISALVLRVYQFQAAYPYAQKFKASHKP